MPFDTQEQSQRGSQKVYLYRFVSGTEVFRFTNAEIDLVVNANSYASEVITHTEARRTFESDAESSTVICPITNVIAQLFIDIPPADGVEVEISAFHRTDVGTEQRVEWQGVIRSMTVDDDGMANLNGKSVISDFSKQVPRDTFQGPCNNFLFDSQCKVNELAFTSTLTVASVSGRQYTITGLSAAGGADPAYFTGGYIDVDSGRDFRMIVEQAGDVATVLLPFPSSIVGPGTSVEVKAGCDHTIATCQSKFANAINYGGCPYVPDRNIFNTGLA